MRRTIGRILPERLKRTLRGRFYGYSRQTSPFTVEISGSSAHIKSAEFDFRIEVASDQQLDILFHFQNNFDSAVEMQHLLRAARSGGVLYDVGAHYCLFALLFARANSANRAVAFDPDLDALRVGAEWAGSNGVASQIAFVDSAVGSSGDAAARMTTIDAAVERLELAPSIVKIDVEGAELDVLRGAAETLRKHRPMILLELHTDLLEQRGSDPADVTRLLTSAGYAFYDAAGSRVAEDRVANSAKAIFRVLARAD